MMKDITERLAKIGERVGIPCPDGIKGCAVFHFRVETDPVCVEAINEIERLREALREITELNLNDPAAMAIFIARAALGEGKE